MFVSPKTGREDVARECPRLTHMAKGRRTPNGDDRHRTLWPTARGVKPINSANPGDRTLLQMAGLDVVVGG